MCRRTAAKSGATAVAGRRSLRQVASGGVFIAATVVALAAVSIYQELISVMQSTLCVCVCVCVACLNCGQSPPVFILFLPSDREKHLLVFPLFSRIFLAAKTVE